MERDAARELGFVRVDLELLLGHEGAAVVAVRRDFRLGRIPARVLLHEAVEEASEAVVGRVGREVVRLDLAHVGARASLVEEFGRHELAVFDHVRSSPVRVVRVVLREVRVDAVDSNGLVRRRVEVDGR